MRQWKGEDTAVEGEGVGGWAWGWRGGGLGELGFGIRVRFRFKIKVDVYLFDRSLCDGEILGLDFHYNVAAIRVKSDVQLRTAVMGNLDDYTECRARFGAASFHLPPHRDTAASRGLIKLCPGMPVIALGRYHNHPCHIMAAPGKLV
ncbi:hypothetical protein BVRB_9g209860 [Beta vulgaris subsp. vulgaris]|nr:hypothetical protein BVRB_9g209860 [Beta vulgaris subsp. vulgaris]